MSIQLTIVIPTLNEAKNIKILIKGLKKQLKNFTWEIIVVDDNSSDKTYEVVNKISLNDNRISCIRRIGKNDFLPLVLKE